VFGLLFDFYEHEWFIVKAELAPETADEARDRSSEFLKYRLPSTNLFSLDIGCFHFFLLSALGLLYSRRCITVTTSPLTMDTARSATRFLDACQRPRINASMTRVTRLRIQAQILLPDSRSHYLQQRKPPFRTILEPFKIKVRLSLHDHTYLLLGTFRFLGYLLHGCSLSQAELLSKIPKALSLQDTSCPTWS
jgi:hypothetical protein